MALATQKHKSNITVLCCCSDYFPLKFISSLEAFLEWTKSFWAVSKDTWNWSYVEILVHNPRFHVWTVFIIILALTHYFCVMFFLSVLLFPSWRVTHAHQGLSCWLYAPGAPVIINQVTQKCSYCWWKDGETVWPCIFRQSQSICHVPQMRESNEYELVLQNEWVFSLYIGRMPWGGRHLQSAVL